MKIPHKLANFWDQVFLGVRIVQSKTTYSSVKLFFISSNKTFDLFDYRIQVV